MNVFPAKMTDGTEYVGNQQFKGNGVVRWCALCGVHKPVLGGTIRHCFGDRHWVCIKHKGESK